MKVLNLTTNQLAYQEELIRVIYNITENSYQYGYCSPDDPRILNVMIREPEEGEHKESFIDTKDREFLTFSNKIGMYLIKWQWKPQELFAHQNVFGLARDMDFPYHFQRRYEAAESFNIFKGRQYLTGPEVQYPLSQYLKYTFGLEFETSQGFVPEDICYRDGLVPLRDGSISGLEYSTVVLEGNTGLNLLRQQVADLKEHTCFDKECALHVHMGGYPLTPKAIFVFYTIACLLEGEFQGFIPRYSFRTSAYKASGKDYCNPLPHFSTFEALYKGIAEQEFFGDLTQPHPADVNRNHKWECHSR